MSVYIYAAAERGSLSASGSLSIDAVGGKPPRCISGLSESASVLSHLGQDAATGHLPLPIPR